MNNLKNLRGTVDLLPDQLIKWQNVEKILLEQLARASIKEIRTPILEMTELFIRGIGEGTDVVSKEMYTFLDRGGRSCTLRPEGTASVARALIQNEYRLILFKNFGTWVLCFDTKDLKQAGKDSFIS